MVTSGYQFMNLKFVHLSKNMPTEHQHLVTILAHRKYCRRWFKNFCNRHFMLDLPTIWQQLPLRPGHLIVYLWEVWVVSRWGKTNSSQTATIVVIKQSLGSWSHSWSLSNVSGCGSTSLFGSHAGTHQIRDQSRALEDRNDSNNSLEVYTPNSFIHLFYNSPYMDVVDMHNVIVTPSDSVLLEKTMEASYLVGSFPCQFNFISVFDIPVWDEFWEQATSRHFCPFR